LNWLSWETALQGGFKLKNVHAVEKFPQNSKINFPWVLSTLQERTTIIMMVKFLFKIDDLGTHSVQHVQAITEMDVFSLIPLTRETVKMLSLQKNNYWIVQNSIVILPNEIGLLMRVRSAKNNTFPISWKEGIQRNAEKMIEKSFITHRRIVI
jgi:hypothetical protein